MPVDYAGKCCVCGHPDVEHPRDWGCGHCCPAPAPEVPMRDPRKYWLDGYYFPNGDAELARATRTRPEAVVKEDVPASAFMPYFRIIDGSGRPGTNGGGR